MVTFKTNSVMVGDGLLCESSARGLVNRTDQIVKFGGGDKAMCPMEMLLSSVGACVTMTARIFAPRLGVELDDVRTYVEGDMDPAPGASLERTKVKLTLKSSSPPEAVAALAAFLETKCPVLLTVGRSAPLEFEWEHEA